MSWIGSVVVIMFVVVVVMTIMTCCCCTATTVWIWGAKDEMLWKGWAKGGEEEEL